MCKSSSLPNSTLPASQREKGVGRELPSSSQNSTTYDDHDHDHIIVPLPSDSNVLLVAELSPQTLEVAQHHHMASRPPSFSFAHKCSISASKSLSSTYSNRSRQEPVTSYLEFRNEAHRQMLPLDVEMNDDDRDDETVISDVTDISKYQKAAKPPRTSFYKRREEDTEGGNAARKGMGIRKIWKGFAKKSDKRVRRFEQVRLSI